MRRIPAGSIRLVLLLAWLGLGVSASADTLDADGDGVLDPFDNCIYVLNDIQDDLAGVGMQGADGIGDACQCGDLDGDGDVDVFDAALLERDLAAQGPGIDGAKCSVASNGPDACTSAELDLLRQALAGTATLSNMCRAAVGTPAKPTGLVAYAGVGEIVLDWEAVPSSLVTGYEVLRSDTHTLAGPYSVVATGETKTSWVDATVTNDIAEFYKVRALYAGGPSEDSEHATATPAASTGPTTVNVDITPTPQDPTVWTLLGSPYRPSAPIHVKEGATLVIEPGVVIEWSQFGQLLVGGAGQTGRLIARGVEEKEIEFRSTSASCGAGEWRGLRFESGTMAGSVLDHVKIECTGEGHLAAVAIDNVAEQLRLSNGTISTTEFNGFYINQSNVVVHGWDITISDAATRAVTAVGPSTIRGSNLTLTGAIEMYNGFDAKFSDLVFPQYDTLGAILLPASLVGEVMNAATIPNHSGREIRVNGSGLPLSASWPAYRYEVRMAPIKIWSNNARTLTLEAGAELYFDAVSGLEVGTGDYEDEELPYPPPLFPGGLIARGTESAKIRLGPLAPGTPWKGVVLNAKTLPQSRLEHVEIEEGSIQMEDGYLGNGACLAIRQAPSTVEFVDVDVSGCPGPAITIDQSSVTLKGGGVSSPGDGGIVCSGTTASPAIAGLTLTGSGSNDAYEGDCAATIEHNTISGWDTGIRISQVQPTLVLRNNDIQGNTSAALVNTDSTTLDARINYWGGVDPSTVVTGPALTSPRLVALPATQTFSLRTASTVPEWFSPASRTKFRAWAPRIANWTLSLSEPGGSQENRVSIGSSFAWDWGEGAANGTYDYTLRAQEYQGTGDVTLAGSVVVDDDLPGARIDQPGELELTSGTPLNVEGKATGTSYRLEYGVGASPTTFNVLANESGMVDGPIDTWVTAGLTEGLYTLRLVASDGVDEAEDRVAVRVLVVDPVTTTATLFAPTGNGLLDWVGVQSATSIETDWTVEFLDAGGDPVHEITGNGTDIYAVWEGEAGLGSAPDATYSVQLTTQDPLSGDPFSTPGGSVEIDTTPPTRVVSSPPTSPAIVNLLSPLPVTGTVDDLHGVDEYELRYALGTPPGPTTQIGFGMSAIIDGTLGTLPAEDKYAPTYANGFLTLVLTAEDSLGNAGTLWYSVPLERLKLTNVAVSPSVIDPYAGGPFAIDFNLSHPADTVDLQFFRSGTSSPAVTRTVSGVQGSNQVMWDGTEADLMTVAPLDGYFLSISAEDTATMREAGFNDPLNPAMGPPYALWTLAFNDDPSLDPDTPINFYQNDELRVSYHLTTPGRLLSQMVSAGSTVPLVNNEAVPGTTNFARFWDGRQGDPNTTIIGPVQYTFRIHPVQAIEADPFFLVHDFRVQYFRTHPWAIHPRLGQATTIYYRLPAPASVSVDILDPNGSTIRALQTPISLSAGDHEIEWNGLDDSGDLPLLEGSHIVRVTAVEDQSGLQHVRNGSVYVFQ